MNDIRVGDLVESVGGINQIHDYYVKPGTVGMVVMVNAEPNRVGNCGPWVTVDKIHPFECVTYYEGEMCLGIAQSSHIKYFRKVAEPKRAEDQRAVDHIWKWKENAK